MPQQGVAQVVRGLPEFDDPDLLVGPENFSDAGVYRLAEGLAIVQTLDFFPPLVDDPFVFGQIAAANSLSDIYAMGGQPRTALNIVGFPDDKLDLAVLHAILRGGADKVLEARAVILGGHTVRDSEIKYGLSVTGTVRPDRMLTNSRAQPGDVLLLTKPLGTGFVTTAFKARRCPQGVLEAACASMIQLNEAGSSAAVQCGAHAATDITGFGLAGHATEVALASKVTMRIETASLPIIAGSEPLVKAGYMTRASATNRQFAAQHMRIEGDVDEVRLEYAFDAQTSGGLLISVPADRAEELTAHARQAGAQYTCAVGKVVEQQDKALILY